MRDATYATGPRSYSKVFQSFRTAACRARRTDLGRAAFVGFHIRRAVPNGFVAELRTQRAPASIEHGFSHPCARQTGSVDVANDDQSMGSGESSRDEMQIMPAAVDDARMDRLRTDFPSGPLRASQGVGMLMQVAR